MSNPPSSLQTRQKTHHQRQQSTPVNFEAVKVLQMPPTIRPRQDAHRRGQSFDMSRSPIQRRPGSAVSMHTNIGSTTGQQILREAQQQRTARPGRPIIQYGTPIAPQCGQYRQPPQMQEISYDMTMTNFMDAPQNMMLHPQFQDMSIPMSAVSHTSYEFDENSQQYFTAIPSPSSSSLPPHVRMMEGIDRRSSHPDLRVNTDMRTQTPSQQSLSGRRKKESEKAREDTKLTRTELYAFTPSATPVSATQAYFPRSLQTSPRHGRAEHEIISPRPVSMQTSRSLQGIAEHQELQPVMIENFPLATTPVRTAQQSIDEPVKKALLSRNRRPSIDSIKPESDSLFGEVEQDIFKLSDELHTKLQQVPSSPTRPALSPRRIEIADLHLDPGISASIEETNISLDEIAQYIEGPDPSDNKYVCKFEDCDKRFGRKENIKSHVQTHLGDRQFRCDHCMKRFVRGHDLKRHAKIHTGTKGYQCLCGNAFARHDALTRHRQRGMCIGAFEGVVRKEIKRGRPRKHRPEMDERLDKSGKTRQSKHSSYPQSQGYSDMYNSSASSCSFSSWGSPPTETMDHLSIHGGGIGGGSERSPTHASPYDDAMNLFGLSAQDLPPRMASDNKKATRDIFGLTPPASPGYSCGQKRSPSYRELTPTELADLDDIIQQQEITVDPTTSINDFASFSSSQSASDRRSPQHTFLPQHISPVQMHAQLPHSTRNSFSVPASLPALSHSSSPPPESATYSTTTAANSLVFDFDSAGDNDNSSSSSSNNNTLRMSTMSGISGIDFGMSLSKIPLPEFESGSGVQSTMLTKNDFDSFLEMDDSQMSLGMNATGMSIDNDIFFGPM